MVFFAIFELSTYDLGGRSLVSTAVEQLLSIGMLIKMALINIPMDKSCSTGSVYRKLQEVYIESLISDLIGKGQARPTSSGACLCSMTGDYRHCGHQQPANMV